MTSPWDLNRDAINELLDGQPRYRIDQVWKGLYEQGLAPSEISTLPKKLREQLEASLTPALELTTRSISDDQMTVKSLWNMSGDAAIETVLMHYPERSTICISSQAGCAMACGFCATGQAGYQRNLSVGEILEQVVRARSEALPRRLSNIVFMGMGEPFANYNRVVESIHRIIDDLGIGARKITVSTVGLVPQMVKFADEGLQVGLAVSLHAANDELRTSLVPLNKRHPIDELVSASRRFRDQTGRRVSFEWAMIDNVNDRISDARELARVAKRASAHVNLIPLNPTPGWPTVGSPSARIREFATELENHGVNVTVRKNRGNEIDAACGQLRANQEATPVKLRKRST